MIRALPWKLNKHYKKFCVSENGLNCNHGQSLNMNKECIRWCWGRFCLLCVQILCGFPFRLSQWEDKEGDFINYPKSLPLLFSSFFFMSVSFSHRFPLLGCWPVWIVPHPPLTMALLVIQEINMSYTDCEESGLFFFFFSHFVVICGMCIPFICHKETDPSKW